MVDKPNLLTEFPEITKEWDYEKNGSLKPQDVSKGSNKKVWWKCEKEHSWEATVADRTSGTGCPFCSDKKVLPGYNDLATTHPEIAKEWNYEKNGSLKPQDISKGSNKKVWWLCEQAHSYEARVANRINGTGCPICSGRKVLLGYNDLATTHPDIAQEWDYFKNGSLTPQDVSKGSNKKVWWKCPMNHSYVATINDRTSGKGCPFCAGRQIQIGFNDLATTNPEIAKEWDYAKNGSLTPQDISKGNQTKVWWLCEKGHSWKATVASRTGGNGCPICAGRQIQIGFNDLATTYPEIAKEWDYEKNIGLKPEMITPRNGRKVWWKCEKGHSWEAIVASRTDGRGCPFCAGKQIQIGFNDLATTNPKIVKEWDYEKNGSLTPQDVSKGSETKVWWLCKKGHSYEATVANKTYGFGCPYCSGQKVLPGYNDLATTHPDIAKEWDYHKNKVLTPQKVSKGRSTKVWWLCEKGHSYEAKISDRTKGHGCPFCSNQEVLIGYNDLATTYPEIAKEWNYEKNKDLKPEMFTHGSETKVWWKCLINHSYVATINSRTSGNGCPFCAGRQIQIGFNDLATTHPEIAKEWDYSKNGSLTPQDVSKGNATKVWWKCAKEHSWKATIASRTNGKGCPICSGQKVLPDYNDLATTNPEIAKEWDYEKNGSLKPQDVSKGSNKKVWWKCEKEHSWEATVAGRTRGFGCPYCSASHGEKTVDKVLNDLNLKYQTQVTFDGLTGINGGKLSYDFGIYENNKLLFLIEYQGIQHYVKIDFFGGEKKLEKQQFHDDLKREYAEKYLNVPLLEIPYEITEYADIFSCIKNFYDHTFKS